MRRLAVILAGVLAILPAPAAAATRVVTGPAAPRPRLHLELPLLDVPFNFVGGFSFPSMQQATWMTTDVYELAHFGIGRIWDPFGTGGTAALGNFFTSLFDSLTFFFAGPLGPSWHHEEWHRVVLSRRREAAENPLTTGFGVPLIDPVPIQFDPGAEARIKANYPADYAHVGIAGLASHYALAENFEKNAFFYDQPTASNFIIGMNYILPPVYFAQCLGAETTGDCAIVARQFYAPNEPPSARPLTEEEKSWVSLQFALSFVNFLDPFVARIRAFETGGAPTDGGSNPRALRWNAAVRALPTPFGEDVRLDLFAKRDRLGFFASIHNGFNRASYFPGLSFELRPERAAGLAIIARADVWLQPKDQLFQSGTHEPGGRIGLRAGVPIGDDRIQPYVEVDAKSKGWVLGNPYLDPNVTGRVGLALNLF